MQIITGWNTPPDVTPVQAVPSRPGQRAPRIMG